MTRARPPATHLLTLAVVAAIAWLPLADAAPAAASPAVAAMRSASSVTKVTKATKATKVITIGWAGDTTPGSSSGNPGHGGRDLFAKVRTQLKAPDLMIVNLEGTYATPGPSKCDGSTSSSCFTFRAPLGFAKALPWAGIDLVNVANNHTFDYRARGFRQTRDALRKNRIAHTGMAGQITVKKVKGIRVATIGFSPYGRNNNLNDISTARRLVKKATRKADVVIVLMHAGAEGTDKLRTPKGMEKAYGEKRGNVRAFSHAVVDAGADLVLGSGPHVLRGIEKYKYRLIAYSLGNFGGKNFNTKGLGGVSGLLTVDINAKGRITAGRFQSLILGPISGVPAIDRTNRGAKLVRRLSTQDFARTWPMDSTGRLTVT